LLDWAVMLGAENKLQIDKEIDQERDRDDQKLCGNRGEREEACADGRDADIDRQSDQGPEEKQQKSEGRGLLVEHEPACEQEVEDIGDANACSGSRHDSEM
jgi:hypothetical protein